jgi:hypothetical protein
MVEKLVREFLRDVSDHMPSDEKSDPPTPRMFQRASDVPDPMPSVRHGEQVATLHRKWVGVAEVVNGESTSFRDRAGRVARRITGRGSLGIDRVMMSDIIRAIDAVAQRCDDISERLAHQDVLVNDVVTIFGEELTRIRVELAAFVDHTKGTS